MRPLVTPEEMRTADEATISAGTPAEVLMERAGRAVARSVIRELGGRYGKRVTVVCGKGNNGGDGFVVARVLDSEGLRVTCCLVSDDEPAGAAKVHLDLLRAGGARVVGFDERHLRCDLVVDAIFGTGFTGEPRDPDRSVLDSMVAAAGREGGPRVISVDVSSAGWVPADLIVAIAAEKQETFFRPADAGGRVEVADIGIVVDRFRVGVVEADDVLPRLPHLAPDDHKTSHGHVAVLSGSSEVPGAPVLTARGAARMGAGYVSLGSTRTVIDAAAIQVPEVLKSIVTDEDSLGPRALEAFGSVLERADALAIGPGLGTGDGQRDLVRTALQTTLPLVLDADALNVLGGSTEAVSQRGALTVLTPHVGEMARLLDLDTKDVTGDRVAAALKAAEVFGCTVVLKGRGTIVATGSRASVIPVGGPELATAGTGDVLTGAIAALVARDPDPASVVAACYTHGVAGDLAGRQIGASGLVAWDVAEALPAAVEHIRGPYAG